MSAPRVTGVVATVTFDDGTTCKMSVYDDVGGASWENDTEHLAATLVIREAIVAAMTEEG